VSLTQYQQFIHMSRYARWRDDLNRRETWDETVDRYFAFFQKKGFVDDLTLRELRDAVHSMRIMPSMRAFMTAGPALERDNVAGFNCSYVAIDHPRAFDEIMYILMCGTGVGFSVERQSVNMLPTVAEDFHTSDTVIGVADSKIGWASAFRELISLLYSGQVPSWDVSKVRPSGAKLKTFGGRASGPAPLVDLFKFTVQVFNKAAGRKLTSLECHDIACKIADIVVVGGVRRSACISLSNLSDERMRNAKSGQWWVTEPHRRLANNSAVYTEKPEIGVFMREWLSLYDSKSGERGIFNREAAKKQAVKSGRRDPNFDFGTNPCAEILLRSKSFCNLTEVVIRENDTPETIAEKVRLAVILGTMQSTLTNFRYLRKDWKKNSEEERLLGVSMTGIMDNALTNGSLGEVVLRKFLDDMKRIAIDTNAEWSGKFGINQSVAITTVKPSGTVSQLVDSASGIHPRYSEYYIRTVRGDVKDPLSQMMYYQGVPCEPDAYKPESTYVFSFPQKAPKGAVLRNDRTAIEQLELYMVYKQAWCEHNVSITVYVREAEWMEVGAWVFKHFNQIGGVSFLPHFESDAVYKQAPYQECDEATYNEFVNKMPNIKWGILAEYEKSDTTTGSHELACTAGGCELV